MSPTSILRFAVDLPPAEVVVMCAFATFAPTTAMGNRGRYEANPCNPSISIHGGDAEFTSEPLCASPENEDAAAIRSLVSEAAETASFEDWDGEGAAPLTRAVVEHAERVADWIAEHALPIPSVEPDPDGRLSFFWEPATGRIGALEAKPDGSLFMTRFDDRHDTDVYGTLDGPLPSEDFAEGIRALYGE